MEHPPMELPSAPTAQLPAPSEDDGFIPRYFEPSQVRFYRSPMGSPRMEIVGEATYLRVAFRRVRPLSDPEHYISVWLGDDKELGILRDPSELDGETQTIIREELETRYFTPVIRRILRVKERFGVHEWQVESSHGSMTFTVSGLHQNIKLLPPARLMVTDVRGNKYDIPDVRQLDQQSYRHIQRHL